MPLPDWSKDDLVGLLSLLCATGRSLQRPQAGSNSTRNPLKQLQELLDPRQREGPSEWLRRGIRSTEPPSAAEPLRRLFWVFRRVFTGGAPTRQLLVVFGQIAHDLCVALRGAGASLGNVPDQL